MTLGSLVGGLLVLFALLVVAGLSGGVGSVELTIWLVLVAAWVAWWLVSRRRRTPTS